MIPADIRKVRRERDCGALRPSTSSTMPVSATSAGGAISSRRSGTPTPGSVLNTLREGLEQAVAERQAELERAELDRRLTEEVADITLPGEARPRGKLHLITQIRREVEDIVLGLGYEVVDGREVETTRYNFDGLNFPRITRPARRSSRST